MQTAITVAPRKTPQRRTRRWLRGLAFAGLLLGAFVAAMYVYIYVSRVSLADAEAEADLSDPDWRLADLEAKRRMVADADNSALHVIAVMRKGAGVSVSGVPNYDAIFAKLTPTAQLNADQERLIRGQLGKIAKPLEEARQLKDMPYGRFKITYSPDFIGTLIPDHQSTRAIADWLLHDAYLLAQEDQPDQAIESCRAIFNAARTMGDEPFLISHLIRTSIQSRGMVAAERALAQGEPSDEALKQLQTLLAAEIAESSWRAGLRGERAGTHVFVTGLRSGAITMASFRASMRMKGPDSVVAWLQEFFPASIWRSYPDYLQHSTKVVELSKRPLHEQRDELRKLDAALAEKAVGNPISFLMPPTKRNVYEADCRSQALLLATWVALACERYRLKHERWPESLDALQKAKLIDAVPLDPYDGQPLRFRRTKEGIVVYALGPDLTDDQGRLDRTHAQATGFDLGFQLWDREWRRQAPLPLVALPEGQ